MKTVIVMEIEHEKPIEDLADIVSGRAYTLDGVLDAKVLVTFFSVDVQALPVKEMAHAN